MSTALASEAQSIRQARSGKATSMHVVGNRPDVTCGHPFDQPERLLAPHLGDQFAA